MARIAVTKLDQIAKHSAVPDAHHTKTTDAGEIVSGRFTMGRMPDGTLDYVLTAQGLGVDPVYAPIPTPPNVFQAVAELDVTDVAEANITGLDGDADRLYCIVAQLSVAVAAVNRFYGVAPNGLTAITYSGRNFYLTDDIYGAALRDITGHMFCGGSGFEVDGDILIVAWLNAPTGRRRAITSKYIFVDPVGVRISGGFGQSYWDDTTTNITSLLFRTTGGTFSGKILLFRVST